MQPRVNGFSVCILKLALMAQTIWRERGGEDEEGRDEGKGKKGEKKSEEGRQRKKG